MTNAEVLDQMMRRLGNRAAVSLRAQCLVELNLAIRTLERGPVKPWFLEATEEETMVAEQEFVALPADFIIETEDGTFEVESEDEGWIEITKVSREKARKETANEDPAFPEGYYLWGSQIIFAPVPDSAYNYRFDYYARTTALVDNNVEASNSWVLEFFNLVTSAALIVIARDHVQSDRMTLNFEKQYSVAYNDFYREVEARKRANETLLLTDEEE